MAGPTSSDDGWSTPSYRTPDTRAADAHPGSEWSTPARTHATPEQDRNPPGRRVGRAFDDRSRGGTAVQPVADEQGWTRGGPVPGREQRAERVAQRRTEAEARRTERSVEALRQRTLPRGERGAQRAQEAQAAHAARPYERGLAWWWALAVLVAITLAGALVDSALSSTNQNAFNIAIVIGSVAGILLVKRSQLFPIVVSPPIVYAFAALVQLYLKKSLSQDKHGALNAVINAVQNYLVYGFPALAAATAAVLIVAGVRLLARR